MKCRVCSCCNVMVALLYNIVFWWYVIGWRVPGCWAEGGLAMESEGWKTPPLSPISKRSRKMSTTRLARSRSGTLHTPTPAANSVPLYELRALVPFCINTTPPSSELLLTSFKTLLPVHCGRDLNSSPLSCALSYSLLKARFEDLSNVISLATFG